MGTISNIPALLSSTKVAIIGAGSVGAACAYACLLKGVCSELILVDIDAKVCEAQVQDLSDAEFYSDITIRVGTLQDAGQSDIIVITAGAKQRPGETRLDLIARNHAILKSCIDGMKPLKSEAILMLVANPVDILTYFAQQLSGLPKNQVFGTGTHLDTERLKGYLARKFRVAESAVHAFILGEHGDSQFPAWSSATIATIPLDQLPESKDLNKKECADYVKNKAYSIIAAKGATYFGIGAVVASICESVFLNTKRIRPISHFIPELGVCLSLPVVLGRHGVLRTMKPPMNEEEVALLQKSADAMRQIIQQYQ